MSERDVLHMNAVIFKAKAEKARTEGRQEEERKLRRISDGFATMAMQTYN